MSHASQAPSIGWYWRRLSRMSPAEAAVRARQQGHKLLWRSQRARRSAAGCRTVRPGPVFSAVLPAGTASLVPAAARTGLLQAADELLAGRAVVLGVARTDLVDPDWFLDPRTGTRAPAAEYAFTINHRAPSVTGDVKQVWELSRHHHVTTLAAAWYLSGDDRYAERAAAHLRSWWADNPFLSGVHWTSGIEVGLRLIAWAWARRLLDGWPGTERLFEGNDVALGQLHGHQRYLEAFRSAGSSANNHVIAEAAGQVVASCAFPWFDESDRWRAGALATLEDELIRNTFASGVNRELATDYHAFVAELGLLAAAEAAASGHPAPHALVTALCGMADAGAALADERGAPPRQGDSDDGRALVVDGAASGRWSSFLDIAGAAFTPAPWWPVVPRTVAGTLVGALFGGAQEVAARPLARPSRFRDAGITILRTGGTQAEIWCRCDGGPHGFLSIAGHAHADALAVEVRHAGTEILADPGTYCYHAEPEWRRYFRSTIAHNTIELAGRDQSEDGGLFLWVRHAATKELAVELAADGTSARSSWTAAHDGYLALDPPARHTRSVSLDERTRSLEIIDVLESTGRHPMRMAFHLGPAVVAELDGDRVSLSWRGPHGPESGVLVLPGTLDWTAHRGETAPILGWHSPRFGTKQPATTLVGTGACGPGRSELVSALWFGDGAAQVASSAAHGVLPTS